ncbi:MAG: triphosphoribosyl-dephospho-CoA synthase [archaeon YNP-LCB-003-016]|nr:triphosphoribosyl-dephospho-CoA synthase [Candidatus Culexarchaeum yellowstonense]
MISINILESRKAFLKFDDKLRSKGLNTGTTVDLTVSSLMMAIPYGLRF